ncbi:MAG TPA: hypothetical protein VFV41_10935 [Streptosporangiaceae bacterium]|nr:hypothetical protein [Streptosporangiaceae bacterium]
MPDLSQSRIARRLGAAVAGGVSIVAAGSGVALADYGPPPPVVVLPGGFSCVVTSQMVGPAGKTISFRLGRVAAGLAIPRGAVTARTQVTITQPSGSGSCSSGPGVGTAGYPGFHALVGVGIQVQQRGRTLSSPFARPATLRLSGPAQIHAGDRFVGWHKTHFSRAHGSYAGHALTALVRGSTDAALLVRDAARPGRAAARRAGVSTAPASLQGEFLAAALLQRGAQPGLGVLTTAQLRATSARARLLAG